jgi:group II intron reverse transcriptase/maturase
VSNFEDKIVQKAVADILEALYEPLFLHYSLGFRPRQGCHSAIRRSYHLLKEGRRSHVVDVDIEKFFNSMNHGRLMEFLQQRISDPRFLRLIAKLLRVGILVEGQTVDNKVGSPQGSIVSPILANIYLHHVLDTWFQKRFASHCRQMVRYADDAIFCFQKESEAKAFLESLRGRMEENHLRLNETKTKMVNFEPDQHQVFHLLGFTFYWAKDRKKNILLKVKTQAERLRAKIHEFKLWIKQNRSRYRTRVLWKKAAEKLRGHYAYYGITFNSKVNFFYQASLKLLFKWLNRRSQKKSMDWPKFSRKLQHHPLPKPWSYKLAKLDQGVFSYAI